MSAEKVAIYLSFSDLVGFIAENCGKFWTKNGQKCYFLTAFSQPLGRG